MSFAVNLSPDQSQQLIYSRFRSNGFPDQFSKLLTAQSGHETGGWTSNVYLTDNNAFGYGYTGNSYKVYAGVEDSVDDLSGYVNRKVNAGIFPDPSTITTPDQWAQLLKNAGYYTDSETTYSNGISRWFNDHLGLVLGLSSGLIIFGFLLFLFLTSRKA